MSWTNTLQTIIDGAREELTRKNEIRDRALERSRALIRFCANSIRATHRREYDLAAQLLGEARAAAQIMCDEARAYPDIYHAGYLQDAMKELAEAAITLALVTREHLPGPQELGVEYAAYLNGLGEACGELRRFALDSLRRNETSEAERMMEAIDEIYSGLVTIDFPDALTSNLRRTSDAVRGFAERTRGELTTAMRQEKLQAALQALEQTLEHRA